LSGKEPVHRRRPFPKDHDELIASIGLLCVPSHPDSRSLWFVAEPRIVGRLADGISVRGEWSFLDPDSRTSEVGSFFGKPQIVRGGGGGLTSIYL